MTTTILQDRLALFAGISLKPGSHTSPEVGMCVNEAASWLAGEPFSDHPDCVSPLLTRITIPFNDRLKTDADRDRFLKEVALQIIGTRTTAADEATRGYLVTDWLVRQRAPVWYRLAGLTAEAQTLEGLARIVDASTARAAAKATRGFANKAWDLRQSRNEALRAELRDATQRHLDAIAASAASDAIAAIAASDAIAASAASAASDAIDAIAASAASDASAASAASDAIAASAASAASAGARSLHEEAARALVAAVVETKGEYSDKRTAGWRAARDVYYNAFLGDERFATIRAEAEKLNQSFVELVKQLCDVGRQPALVGADEGEGAES